MFLKNVFLENSRRLGHNGIILLIGISCISLCTKIGEEQFLDNHWRLVTRSFDQDQTKSKKKDKDPKESSHSVL